MQPLAVDLHPALADPHVHRYAADVGGDDSFAVLHPQPAVGVDVDAFGHVHRLDRAFGIGALGGCGCGGGFASQRAAHEIGPDFRGQTATGDLCIRGVVVVADPYADHQIAREPHEQRVAVVLGSAGLAIGGDAEPRGAPGAAIYRAAQKLAHRLALAARDRLAAAEQPAHPVLIGRGERGCGHGIMCPRDPGVGGSQFEQRDARGAQREAGVTLRERRAYPQIARSLDHRGIADFAEQADRCDVA